MLPPLPQFGEDKAPPCHLRTPPPPKKNVIYIDNLGELFIIIQKFESNLFVIIYLAMIYDLLPWVSPWGGGGLTPTHPPKMSQFRVDSLSVLD